MTEDLRTGCAMCGGSGCLFCRPMLVKQTVGPVAAPVDPPAPPIPTPAPIAAGEERVVFVPSRGSQISESQVTQATALIKECGRATTSLLQRRLRLGYTQACRLMEVLEERGIVGPPRGLEPREILV